MDKENKEKQGERQDLSTFATFVAVNTFECGYSVSTAINQYSTTSLGLTVYEFAFTRCLCNFLVSSTVLIYFKTHPTEGINKDMLLPLSVRCVIGNIAYTALTYVFKILPLSIGTVILSTSPFVVVLFANIFLKEGVTRVDIIAIIVSFTGIIIMALGRPQSHNSTEQYWTYVIAILLAVFVMIAIALIAITARYMKSLNFAVIQFWNSVFGVCFTGSLLLHESLSLHRRALVFDKFSTYEWITVSGLINSFCQNLMIFTMQNSNPAAISLFRYVGVFYGFLWDLSIFKRSFGFMEIAGLSVIFCANIAAVIFKAQAEKMRQISPKLISYMPLVKEQELIEVYGQEKEPNNLRINRV